MQLLIRKKRSQRCQLKLLKDDMKLAALYASFLSRWCKVTCMGGRYKAPSVVERDNAEIYCCEMRLLGFARIHFFVSYQVSIS